MSKKMLIILVIGLLAAAIIGGGGFFYLKGKGSASEKGAAAEGTQSSAEKATADKNKINFPLENFIVNLADPGGKRYLSTRIVLELNDKGVVLSLEKKVPEMRDRILMILPTKTFKEIQSVEGKNALRSTLITELNGVLQEGQITNIFFQEFVVQ
ncbi:MAG: flagellar basal body-associated FliL family protein [Candidatus Desulfacyla sp.]